MSRFLLQRQKYSTIHFKSSSTVWFYADAVSITEETERLTRRPEPLNSLPPFADFKFWLHGKMPPNEQIKAIIGNIWPLTSARNPRGTGWSWLTVCKQPPRLLTPKKQRHFTNDKTKCQADTKRKTEPIKCQETCGVAVSPSVWLVLTFNQRFARQLWATALNASWVKVLFVFLWSTWRCKHGLPADNKHHVRWQYICEVCTSKLAKGDFKTKSFRIVFSLIIYWRRKDLQKTNSPVFFSLLQRNVEPDTSPEMCLSTFLLSAKFTSWTEVHDGASSACSRLMSQTIISASSYRSQKVVVVR